MSTLNPTIRKPQFAALVALHASIIISWIAYHNYDEKLLVQFNLTDYGTFLVMAKAVILFLMPPLAGLAADAVKKKRPHAATVFTVGISLTAMIFFTVATSIGVGLPDYLIVLVPLLIIFWLISMNIFNSPAYSLLDDFVPAEQMPRAMAIVVLVGDLLYALEPSIVYLIDFIGASATFALGGVLILGSGLALGKVSKNYQPQLTEDKASSNGSSMGFLWSLLAGIGVGLPLVLAMKYIPEWSLSGMGAWFPDSMASGLISSVLLGLTALFAIPASRFLQGKSLGQWLLISLGVAIVAAIGLYLLGGNAIVGLILSIVFAAAFALASVAGLPLALEGLKKNGLVFGIGLFFSGMELPSSIADILTVL